MVTNYYLTNIILILTTICCGQTIHKLVDPAKTLVWGPGLKPDIITVPARYFFIQAVDRNGQKFRDRPAASFSFDIIGSSVYGKCRFNHNYIDRGDGSAIIRYKIVDICENVKLIIKYNGTHVAKSPYSINGNVYSEKCNCPQNYYDWFKNNECPRHEERITDDLQPFKRVNFSSIRDSLLHKYNMPGSVSLCHYIVKNQNIYRQCYGKYTGFKMFMDATLLSMTRIVKLPDIEFYMNLGDWPLSKKGGQQRTAVYPIFSWCGSKDSFDIVLPTYDITKSTLENMGTVMLDMLSVQKSEYPWQEKSQIAFWRGRDSRRERLNLIDLSRQNPDLINASLTNFFFFRDEEEKYGPKVAHISFLEFFQYKYQITIDGTVAAYRLPYLIGGDSLVFKQDSPFYEHFYHKLIPNKHYIPFKRDLSDLLTKVQWAKENDDRAHEITVGARSFVEENLLPVNIYCYHALLFDEWSKRLVSPIVVLPGMEKLEQSVKCDCKKTENSAKDEL